MSTVLLRAKPMGHSSDSIASFCSAWPCDRLVPTVNGRRGALPTNGQALSTPVPNRFGFRGAA